MSHDQKFSRTIAPSWQDRLEAARSESEVMQVVRDFLAQWNPEEIASLPAQCRPEKMVDANDVSGYAFVLVSHECAEEEASARVVHKLADFMAKGSTRLSQILAVPRSPDVIDTRRSA